MNRTAYNEMQVRLDIVQKEMDDALKKRDKGRYEALRHEWKELDYAMSHYEYDQLKKAWHDLKEYIIRQFRKGRKK